MALACAVAALGCEMEESSRLVDYLDDLEFDVPLETAKYVSLGEFDIPIAAGRKRIDDGRHGQRLQFVAHTAPPGHGGSALPGPLHAGDAVHMRLQFELMAETTPDDEHAVLEAAERHRGAMNDAVLTVVRTSTVEELADPRLSAVKARLSDITRPMLGEERVRQLVFSELAANSMKHGDGHGAKGEHGSAKDGHEPNDGHGAKEKSGGHH
jgi:hypothetical protein